jgi:pyridoxine 5-phosphate synthase
LAELGGADSITIHLREDRRHIQDRDLQILRQTVSVPLNLELSCNAEIVDIACRTKPDQATLVPESRQEITTEGGLDVVKHRATVAEAVKRLQDAGIVVSLFLDADPRQLETAGALGATAVELHTGRYADARAGKPQAAEPDNLRTGGALIRRLGLKLHAGHGLNYHNVQPVAQIEGMAELNIGHSIVARAIMVGFERAVREMKQLIG